MSILISREELLGALAKVNAPFNARSGIFSSSSALFNFSEKKLKVTLTDLELSLQVEIPIDRGEKANLCLPFKKIFSLVKELRCPQLEIEAEDERVSIRCEKCEYKLNGFSPDKFPKIPLVKDRPGIRIEGNVLAEMIDLTKFCVFGGESNYVLGGVLLELEKDEVRMVGTDGKRLAFSRRRTASSQPELNKKINVIVPLRAITEVKRLAGEEVVLVVGENRVEFDIGNVRVISQVIEGEYPSYSKYIPPESKNKLKVRRDDFLYSLRRVNVLATSDYPGIKIELAKNKMVLSKNTPEIGSLREELAVEYSGTPLSLGFNPQYLIDVLKVLRGEEAAFDVYGPEKPWVAREEGYVYLALPMKLD